MDPKGLLPFSLQPATCCIREPHQPSPRSTILFKFHFNIILLSMPTPPTGLLSSRFPTKHQNAFLFSPHMPDRPTHTHLILLNLIIWSGVQITQLLATAHRTLDLNLRNYESSIFKLWRTKCQAKRGISHRMLV